jgi:hypothetical protein
VLPTIRNSRGRLKNSYYDANGNMTLLGAWVAIVSAPLVFSLAAFSAARPLRPGDDGPAARATIDRPSRLAFDSQGDLFLYEDSDDLRPAIRKIETSTGRITTLLLGCDLKPLPPKESDLAPRQDDCLGPVGDIRVIRGNRLLVTEFTENRVRSIDLHTKVLSLVAGNGGLEFGGDGGPAPAAGLKSPYCAVPDQAGNIFICERGRIRRIDAKTGIIDTFAGADDDSAAGNQAPATEKFSFPSSIAVDAAGNLFVADDGYRIRRIDGKTRMVKTVAGTGRPGRFPFPVSDGPATEADLFSPAGLVLDKRGGLLFINADDRVFRLDIESQMLTTIAGRGTPGFDGDGGPATQAHIDVWGMALDSTGDLFLADWEHNRIRRVDAKTGIITTFAGTGLPTRGSHSPIL